MKTPPLKIVLIGFAGSGKSTIATLLSEVLHFRHIECDQEILKLSGLDSISEIFKKYGENHFRELESKIAAQLRDCHHCVISPGGGMIFKTSNLENLKYGDSLTIYLETEFETLKTRILATPGGLSNRPLLHNETQARDLYQKRLIGYSSAADLFIKTDSKSADQVTNEILEVLNRKKFDD